MSDYTFYTPFSPFSHQNKGGPEEGVLVASLAQIRSRLPEGFQFALPGFEVSEELLGEPVS